MVDKILPYVDKILKHSNDIFVIKDSKNKIVFVNDKIKEYGYDPDSLIGKSYLSLLSKKHKGVRFEKIVSNKVAMNYEVEFLKKDGTIVNAISSNGPVWSNNGNILFVVSILTDITHYKMLQKKLEKSTHKDYLTGLYNMRYFNRRIKEEIKRANRKGEKLAVIMLDIDNFKKYNDFFGHEKGNKLLKKMGTIIKNSIREGVDLGFRFGGDEFLIVVNETDKIGIMEIASRLREKFLKLNEKFLDLSLGIAYYRASKSIKDLIVEADRNLYKAKDSKLKIIE